MRHSECTSVWILTLLLVSQVVTAAPLFQGNPYTESRGADMLLPVRQPVCSDALNGKIYVFGGRADNWFTFTNAIQVYDIASDSWSIASGTMPYAYVARPNEGATIWGGKIYITPGLGPTDNNGWGQHQRIIEFDPVTETAVEKASFGATVWDTSPVSIGNYVYWLGACGIGQERKIWQYDPLADSMQHVCDLAGIGRTGSAIAVEGKAYLFGGEYMGTERTDIDIYDPSTNNCVLSSVALPVRASPHVWPGPDDLVYMMATYHSLWGYQLSSDTIEDSGYTYSFNNLFSSMGQGYDPATGKVYYFGGWDDAGGNVLDSTYILAPNAVSEPGTLALLVVGIGAPLLRRRR